MSEKPQEWKNYEDFAKGIATNRLPASTALIGRHFTLHLNNGRRFSLDFLTADSVSVTTSGQDTREWCEVVLVAPETYFIDIKFLNAPDIAETLIMNTRTNRALSIRSVVRPPGVAPGEPRVAQEWVAAIIGGQPISGEAPHETRDLIGLRALYTYSPDHVYEHIYLSSQRYCWQNLKGVQYGHGDADLATTFKFAPNQYVFGFREFIIPVASVFFYNFDDLRSTGKFLGETKDGSAQNSPAGAFIQKLSMTFYPPGVEPV